MNTRKSTKIARLLYAIAFAGLLLLMVASVEARPIVPRFAGSAESGDGVEAALSAALAETGDVIPPVETAIPEWPQRVEVLAEEIRAGCNRVEAAGSMMASGEARH